MYNDDVPMLKLFHEELSCVGGVGSSEFKSWLIGMAQRIEAEGFERGQLRAKEQGSAERDETYDNLAQAYSDLMNAQQDMEDLDTMLQAAEAEIKFLTDSNTHWSKIAHDLEADRDRWKQEAESRRERKVVVEELGAKVAEYEIALTDIAKPSHYPEFYEAAEWWKHVAEQRGDIARKALGK